VKKRQKGSRKARTVKIALLVLLAVAVVFAGMSMAGMKLILDSEFGRFDRPDPATTVEMHHSDLTENYPLELVSFLSGKNRLQGYLYPTADSPGLVVVAHGLGGGADSYLPQIRYFLDKGWSVFAYDATACYDSEGEAVRGFPQGILDLHAALRFVESRPDLAELPVVIFGHSWGGYSAANVLHYDHDIAGIVAVAAPSSAAEMIVEQGRQMMGWLMDTQRPFVWLYQVMLFGKAALLDGEAALNKAGVPALIVHGTGDKVVFFDGSGIISKKDRIINPKVQFLAIDEEGRNGHNSILLSREAIAYASDRNAELRALSEQYGGEIPYEVQREFFAKIDKEQANELNLELMETIHNFFLSCL
jgi:pimeloyl-ACP methyl ester carboxylesterase